MQNNEKKLQEMRFFSHIGWNFSVCGGLSSRQIVPILSTVNFDFIFINVVKMQKWLQQQQQQVILFLQYCTKSQNKIKQYISKYLPLLSANTFSKY